MTIPETQEPGWSQVMKHATNAIWLLFMVIWCFYKVFILSSWQVIHVSIYGEFQKEIGLNFTHIFTKFYNEYVLVKMHRLID